MSSVKYAFGLLVLSACVGAAAQPQMAASMTLEEYAAVLAQKSRESSSVGLPSGPLPGSVARNLTSTVVVEPKKTAPKKEVFVPFNPFASWQFNGAALDARQSVLFGEALLPSGRMTVYVGDMPVPGWRVTKISESSMVLDAVNCHSDMAAATSQKGKKKPASAPQQLCQVVLSKA